MLLEERRQRVEKEKISTSIIDTTVLSLYRHNIFASALFSTEVHGASYDSSLHDIMLALIGRIPTMPLIYFLNYSYFYLADRISIFITAGR